MFVWGVFVIGKNLKTSININKSQKVSNVNNPILVQETKNVVESYFCSECGNETKIMSKYCSNCGTKIE